MLKGKGIDLDNNRFLILQVYIVFVMWSLLISQILDSIHVEMSMEFSKIQTSHRDVEVSWTNHTK